MNENTLSNFYSGNSCLQYAQNHWRSSVDSIISKFEVAAVIEEMIQDVEVWSWTNESQRVKTEILHLNQHSERLQKDLNLLSERESKAQQKLAEQAALAKDLKERFLNELLLVQEEIQMKEKLEIQNKELQKKANRANDLEKELAKAQKQIQQMMLKKPSTGKSLSASSHSTFSSNGEDYAQLKFQTEKKEESNQIKITEFKDKILLKIFQYLPANGVLAAASVNKRLYKRVDHLFAMGSQVQFAEPLPELPKGKEWQCPTCTLLNPEESQHCNACDWFREPEIKTTAAPLSHVAEQGALPIFNQTIAQSITKKLNSSELKGILGLQHRVFNLENVVSKLTLEKEDLTARLQGTDSVKEFLLTQVKDTEDDLKKAQACADEAQRQHVADLEVIGFLDNRVQELEKQLAASQIEFHQCFIDLEEERKIKKEKVRAVEDLITFQKEKSEQMEAQFKKEKKLLVTEVKKLRTQSISLEAEKDSYKLQLQELRQSVSRLRS